MKITQKTLPTTLKVDLHDFQPWEATLFLKETLDSSKPSIKEIVVIHGYHSGQHLMNMVRNDFIHPKIKNKFVNLNQGTTTFVLY